MRLVKGLYWYPYRGFRNNCNTCLFDDEIRVIIDPGHEWNLESLLASLRDDGFNPKDIDLIINTHVHPDHYEASHFLAEVSGAKMALHSLEERYLKGESRRLYQMFGANPPSLTVDFHLAESLNLGITRLEVLHTPGHSPGSISIYWREQSILICGDLIFSLGVGRVDLPGGDPHLLKESIEMVSKLDIRYLLPGHGEILEGREKIKRNFNYVKEAYFGWM
ncbi:MAG: MBL fold metallo-hydrolase [Nitrososphaeria archaeon]|nr:MBL fold metallo-hydrolase [Nitrososphaeria archaeon]NIN53011.1 MBL fold metallo-hydrolase [Nitrososphaeria archaeon]NIQ33570.1 MBL fold metallo-hydrolase [Nitrososphaeria archaeon]